MGLRIEATALSRNNGWWDKKLTFKGEGCCRRDRNMHFWATFGRTAKGSIGHHVAIHGGRMLILFVVGITLRLLEDASPMVQHVKHEEQEYLPLMVVEIRYCVCVKSWLCPKKISLSTIWYGIHLCSEYGRCVWLSLGGADRCTGCRVMEHVITGRSPSYSSSKRWKMAWKGKSWGRYDRWNIVETHLVT